MPSFEISSQNRVDVKLEKKLVVYLTLWSENQTLLYVFYNTEPCLNLNSINNWMALGFLCHSGLYSMSSSQRVSPLFAYNDSFPVTMNHFSLFFFLHSIYYYMML